MHLFELNYDVLLEIISSIGRSELPSFIQTCRMAHDLAMPHLLSCVHLYRDLQQVHDFCEFMLSDSPRWIPMLRILRILEIECICGPKHTSLRVLTGSLLADVLKHACNLNCLRLDHLELLLE